MSLSGLWRSSRGLGVQRRPARDQLGAGRAARQFAGLGRDDVLGVAGVRQSLSFLRLEIYAGWDTCIW